jgi:hypothetical protein
MVGSLEPVGLEGQFEDISAEQIGFGFRAEHLDRGVVALPAGEGRIYVGWRLLKGDPNDIAFNVTDPSGASC